VIEWLNKYIISKGELLVELDEKEREKIKWKEK
jgi:hypothetical protein